MDRFLFENYLKILYIVMNKRMMHAEYVRDEYNN